ncbi:MAG: carbon-nitrogen hydrolase family protein [Sulfurifustaceae bacterium]
MIRAAIVQQPPILLDRTATVRAAVNAVRDAAGAGANLVVFPEAYVPGYPVWIWRARPGTDARVMEHLHARLMANAVDIEGGDLQPLCIAAREHKTTIVCGVNERDTDFSRGTLYNSVVVIDADGAIVNRHRKLMPTYPERMVWGFGDASGLRVVDTPCGRVGTLICWENLMPLARYALYAQGVEIYIAPTYDCGDRSVATFRHIAREGGCWVLAAGTAVRGSDIPDDFPARAQLYPDAEEWVNLGDSLVVDPGGSVVAGPLRREVGVLYADIDLDRVAAAKRMLDVAGHYARPDIFQLHVNREPLTPVAFADGNRASAPGR